MSETSFVYGTDRIAARDAVETDGENARKIERVDFASGKLLATRGAATRGNSAAISAADALDLTALPADLTGNLITVGDKSMLTVDVEQSVSGGTCTVTPIWYDNAGAVIGVGTPKAFTQPYAFRRGNGSGNYVLPDLSWDVRGAWKIGLHITALTGTDNVVKIWGEVI